MTTKKNSTKVTTEEPSQPTNQVIRVLHPSASHMSEDVVERQRKAIERRAQSTKRKVPKPEVTGPTLGDQIIQVLVEDYRALCRAGNLEPWKVTRLEQIPGWTW